MKRPHPFLLLSAYCLVLVLFSPFSAHAAPWPSLFRGVVVADDDVGVRVVSVEEGSQGAEAGLRPEDLIIQAHGRELSSLEDFAAVSQQLKGQVSSTTLVVFRHGAPLQLRLHLFSYPVLRSWGIEFIPEHDVRFSEAKTGLAYWVRLGRGFEHVGRDAGALNAYLNGLHAAPGDQETALKAIRLLSRLGQARLREEQLAAGLGALQQALTMMERLFAVPLDDTQLAGLRDELRGTVEALRHVSRRRDMPLLDRRRPHPGLARNYHVGTAKRNQG